MIPYVQWEQFSVGPLTIQVWGLFVALGMAVGLAIAVWCARQRQLNPNHIMDMGFWIVLSSMIFSRVLYVLTEWQTYSENPFDVFRIWEGGLSITGGFLGAVIAALIYTRRKQISFWEYGECCVFGLPIGLFIGRIGCFLIYDHPGTPTSFILGQTYLDGIVRHNHGLYLSIQGLVIAVLFFVLYIRNRKRGRGFYSSLFLIVYGVSRFILDFWRATDLPFADARYWHLTVAQYVSIVMVAAGVWIWYNHFNGTLKKKETSSTQKVTQEFKK